MANAGKSFEEDFIKSVPDNVFRYRFKDGTAAWGNGENTRFQAQNICDFMLFDGKLFLLELKSHKGKSIPFSCIRENQLKELLKADEHIGITAGMIFNFRDVNKTYFIKICYIEEFYNGGERKSFPISFAEDCGVEIKSELKKVHYRYDIAGFLKGARE